MSAEYNQWRSKNPALATPGTMPADQAYDESDDYDNGPPVNRGKPRMPVF